MGQTPFRHRITNKCTNYARLSMFILFCLFLNWFSVTSLKMMLKDCWPQWQTDIYVTADITVSWVKSPCRDDIIHWSFIISYIAAALLLSSVATLQSKARGIYKGMGEGCSYIIKVKASFKQDFSLLFSLRPCPISLPGHAVLQECGHKSLTWGLGLGKQAGEI